LAADTVRPERAVAEGLAEADGLFVYAVGRLALLLPGNPATAPYGRAASEALAALGLAETYADRLARGNNIAQTFQFVATGNADAGFVALSQVTEQTAGDVWVVPEALHGPIAQAAVLLEAGRDVPAARAFVEFLRGGEARAIIRRHGYGVTE
jgi:molybdate transport system substrate-binding protein